MEEINASIEFDRKLAAQDIAGSEAHLAMLARQGIVEAADAEAIAKGLAQVKGEIEAGTFSFSRALEDIHMNVESRLSEIVGAAAGRLHTARSRNDQVAVDFRLWVRDAIDAILREIAELQRALAVRALDCAAMVMPGFTHLQSAQPVTFGHHLLAYVEMLARDEGRFKDARRRLNECPLGSAALAGTSFPIDRDMTAKALGFDRPTANSLDSVADRDFALEALSAAAIAATHLSRFAEEIVLWTTPQFGFVRLCDAFSTGSSIMPQKRNPDAAELVRGKTGRIVGGARRAAHGDEGPAARLFQGHAGGQGRRRSTRFETLSLCLAAMTGMVKDLTPERKRMKAAAGAGYATATDLADWLVRALDMPFREAHHVTGRIVALAASRGVPLGEAHARRHEERRAAHHRRGLRRARRRAVGQKPDVLRRNGAGQRAPPGARLAETAQRGMTRERRRTRSFAPWRSAPLRVLRVSIAFARAAPVSFRGAPFPVADSIFSMACGAISSFPVFQFPVDWTPLSKIDRRAARIARYARRLQPARSM